MYEVYKTVMYYKNHCGYLLMKDAIKDAAKKHGVCEQNVVLFMRKCGFEF